MCCCNRAHNSAWSLPWSAQVPVLVSDRRAAGVARTCSGKAHGGGLPRAGSLNQGDLPAGFMGCVGLHRSYRG